MGYFEPERLTMTTAEPSELILTRADGQLSGDNWNDNFQDLPGGAGISIILESRSQPGTGPRLHQHPYPETFIIRRGSATFMIGTDQLVGHAGQVLVAPAETPHKFTAGSDGYEAVHIHASPRFVTDWLE